MCFAGAQTQARRPGLGAGSGEPGPARAYNGAMAKLYFYYSAMNAGKSTTLLQSAHNYRERGMRTMILTPRLDRRAGIGVVSSRIGLRAQAHAFEPEENLLGLVRADIQQHGRLHCLLVDEAQFLHRDQVWQLTDIVDELDVPVLAYGLRTDFRAELFEGSRHLLAWADEISEIKTICHSGSKATMVVRLDDAGRVLTEGEQVQIGGNERYLSVSRREFKRLTRGEAMAPASQPSLPLELALGLDLDEAMAGPMPAPAPVKS